MFDGAGGRRMFRMESLEPRRMLSTALEDVAAAGADPSEAVVWEWKQRSIHFERNEAISSSHDGVYRDDLGRFEANLAPGEYSVMIDWGDGTTSAGWIVHYLQEPFDGQSYGVHVRGDHVYAEPGKYKIVATVITSDGMNANFYQDFIPFASPIQLVNQHAFSYPGDHRVYCNTLIFPSNIDIDQLTGTIDWGDGTTTQVSAGEMIWSGAIPLGADHVYAEFGTYTITLTATAPINNSDQLATTTVTETIAVQPPTPPEVLPGGRDGPWGNTITIDLFEQPNADSEDADVVVGLPPTAPPPPQKDAGADDETMITLLGLAAQTDLMAS